MGRLSVTIVMAALVLAGCDQNMIDQHKAMPGEASGLFPDGKVNQAPPPGTVARDHGKRLRELTTRPNLTRALMERGRERYDIHCAPCHGLAGDGDGIIPRHGFPHPPDYLSPRLMQAPAAYFVSVITHGHGVMYAYADRVAPSDRWAIAAWIRVLQSTRNTP